MKNLPFILLILTMIVFTCSCQNEPNPNGQNTGNASSQQPPTSNTTEEQEEKQAEKIIETVNSEPFQEKDMIYAWVDKLNIRDKPGLNGKAIASADSEDALKFTGTKSGKTETVVLRGVAYTDLWYKVATKDGQEGWVYGGAVKRKNEQKGNDIITKDKVDFPYFGTYDLTKWEKVSSKPLDGEEIDGTVVTYKKGDRSLEITQSSMGEFYYGYDYRLLDADKNILKARKFDFNGDGNEIAETVTDYTQNPPKQYVRKQNLDVHFYQLKPRPVMALGNWSVRTIEEIKLNNLADYANCSKVAANDSGCSCEFTLKNNSFVKVFASDYGENGCININGNTVALTDQEYDNSIFEELLSNSEGEDWIVLNEKGSDLLFGKKTKFSDYNGLH